MTGKTEFPEVLTRDEKSHLRQAYEAWVIAFHRADDSSLSEEKCKEAVEMGAYCEKVAAGLPAQTLRDMAAKTLMAMDFVDNRTSLHESLEKDCRAALLGHDAERALRQFFNLWESLSGLYDDLPNLGEEPGEYAYKLVDQITTIAADIPAVTAEGLALKVIMAGDLAMSKLPIVAGVKRDVERLAGRPLLL